MIHWLNVRPRLFYTKYIYAFRLLPLLVKGLNLQAFRWKVGVNVPVLAWKIRSKSRPKMAAGPCLRIRHYTCKVLLIIRVNAISPTTRRTKKPLFLVPWSFPRGGSSDGHYEVTKLAGHEECSKQKWYRFCLMVWEPNVTQAHTCIKVVKERISYFGTLTASYVCLSVGLQAFMSSVPWFNCKNLYNFFFPCRDFKEWRRRSVKRLVGRMV